MLREELKLSDIGLQLFDKAVEKSKIELKEFNNLRTRFFYPVGITGEIEYIDLRDVIDGLMDEFKLKFPFGDRKSPYAVMINNKAFELFNMKTLRLSPNNFVITLRKENGEIIFIIHDSSVYPDYNMKVIWNKSDFKSGKMEKISFHITREMLDLE